MNNDNLKSNTVPLDRGIGSEFWLPTEYSVNSNTASQFRERLPNGKKVFVTSGREAIYQIIKCLQLGTNDNVLLPSYLDWTVPDPFLRTNTNIRFYKIKSNLEFDPNDIQHKIDGHTKAILLIHYFGFPQPLDILAEITKSIHIIEDVTHSWLSTHENVPSGSIGDISYAGFRKLLPIPDCAMISFNNPIFSSPSLSEPDLGHILYKHNRELAFQMNGYFIATGDPFFRIGSQTYFRTAEELIQVNYSTPCATSLDSLKLLESLDFQAIIKRRRDNYSMLAAAHFDGITPLYANLPDGVCPLGFPIFTEKRDALKNHLIKHNIFPPIHWDLPDYINKTEFDNSWTISNMILTIPIDQRYNRTHMEYIIQTLSSF